MEHLIWNVDPVLLSLGSFKIHWYGALFATAILSGLQVMKWIFATENLKAESLDTLLSYVVFGIIIGARLGHCFFYDPGYYFSNPLKILAIWEGGLASHGGVLGVMIATVIYAKKHDTNYLWLLDRLAVSTALFGVFVRCANFVNSEILGVTTNVPWAIVFSRIDDLPRHPAQLYEAFSYLIIFVILLSIYKKFKANSPNGLLFGTCLTLVFTSRFLIESVKQKQAAYTTDVVFNTGQLLSIPFLILGIVLVVLALKKLKDNTSGK